jgi:hypothetical protein
VAIVPRGGGVKVLKAFSSDTSLAARLTETKSDPYKIIWNK